MSETERLGTFETGPSPARYLIMAIVTEDGGLRNAAIRQQRVHHPIYGANDYKPLIEMFEKLAALRAKAAGEGTT